MFDSSCKLSCTVNNKNQTTSASQQWGMVLLGWKPRIRHGQGEQHGIGWAGLGWEAWKWYNECICKDNLPRRYLSQ